MQEGSPASRAGLKSGDVITAYNGREVGRAEELPRAVAETAVGREVPVSVVRDGKTLTLTATVSRLAESEEAAATQTDGKEALGLVVQPLTPAVAKELGLHDRQGVLVRDVEEGSRAANAGLRPGDVVVEIDHQPIRSVDDLEACRGEPQEGHAGAVPRPPERRQRLPGRGELITVDSVPGRAGGAASVSDGGGPGRPGILPGSYALIDSDEGEVPRRRTTLYKIRTLRVTQPKLSQSIRVLEQSSKTVQGAGARLFLARRATWLARGCGRSQEASRLAGEALRLARAHKERGDEAWALRLLGDLASDREPLELSGAEGHYSDALALADALGMRPLVAHCHRGLGLLYRRTGALDRGRRELRIAGDLYHELGMVFWQEPINGELVELQ